MQNGCGLCDEREHASRPVIGSPTSSFGRITRARGRASRSAHDAVATRARHESEMTSRSTLGQLEISWQGWQVEPRLPKSMPVATVDPAAAGVKRGQPHELKAGRRHDGGVAERQHVREEIPGGGGRLAKMNRPHVRLESPPGTSPSRATACSFSSSESTIEYPSAR